MIDYTGWSFPVALVVLLVLAVAVAWIGQLAVRAAIPIAAGRAVVQLALVSLAITAVLRHLIWSLIFLVLMLVVAVFTSARRSGVRAGWPWVAVSVAAGPAAVLVVIFGTGVAPLTGPAIVPIAGIVIGGAMTAHSLVARRAFANLSEEYGQLEAGLSLGLSPADATREVIHRRLPEALHPALDQTKTVGLVTLPGTFVGVLLGGGSPLQAGASQVLTLVGILTAQVIVVVLAERFICSGRLLPTDLRAEHGHAWS